MNKNVLTAVLVLVIVTSIGFIVRGPRPPPDVGRMIMQGVADVSADEIAKLVGTNATIAVIQGTGSLTDSEAVARLPDQLTKAIGDMGILQIIAREKIITYGADLSDWPEGTPIPLTARNPTPQLPWEVFAGVLQKHPGVGAVVSLIGPPRVTAQDAAKWKGVEPKIVVVLAAGDPLPSKQPLKQGFVDLAILPRIHGEPVGTSRPDTPRAWFDSQYQVLTPETEAQMK